MDRQPSTCTENRTATAVLTAYEHTIGKDSRSWIKWWERASLDLEGIGIALYGALLSLGAPPHPSLMTKDQWDIAIDSLPHHPKDAYRRELNRLDMAWRRQHYYNKQLNRFAHKHGLVFHHKTHDPAQFRKLFSAFCLHACKGEVT